jgi:L,D-transpeptidase YcbB
MHNLAFGGDAGFVKFNGINYHPDNIDLPAILADAFSKDNLKSNLTTVEPTSEEFTLLKKEYLRLLMISRENKFNEITVTSKDIKYTNNSLVNKLRQLAYLADEDTTQKAIQDALQSLQRHHKLLPQNVINSSCLEALNEPIAHKLEEMIWNIKWYRWLNGMKDKSHIVVNIPSNTLTYFEDGKNKVESRIVVGKLSTPTPTLTSEIKNVIYYPYWNVPHSIAVNEILPIVKRNPGYLKRSRIEALSNGNVVTGINWHSYSASNFPFQLRQKTGCNNALGLLKFDFENPFHVYLHDTNVKIAFSANKRFFSHGCMRVEKPYELAVALGVPAKRINMKDCLQNKRPETIPLPQAIPVFVTYATIDVVDGQIYWYEDAYRRITSK